MTLVESTSVLLMVQRHSTLFGFVAAIIIAALILEQTRSPAWTTIAFVVVLFLAARTFYGWSAARKMESEKGDDPSLTGFNSRDMAGIGAGARRLESAYDEFRVGDPSALEEIAREESEGKADSDESA